MSHTRRQSASLAWIREGIRRQEALVRVHIMLYVGLDVRGTGPGAYYIIRGIRRQEALLAWIIALDVWDQTSEGALARSISGGCTNSVQ